MVNNDIPFEISQLKKRVKKMETQLYELTSKKSNNQDLWTDADIMTNWHVSQRTVKYWRANKKINSLKIGGRIFYTPEHRDAFLKKWENVGVQ